MSYGPIWTHNSRTNAIEQVTVTDTWILANLPQRLALTASKTQLTANGTDAATITVRRTTPKLLNGSTQNVAGAGVVVLLIGDERIEVTLDATGTGVLEVSTVEVGSFTIQPAHVPGDILNFQGVN